MEWRDLIIKELEQKGVVRTAEIVAKTGFSRSYVHRFLKQLKDEGKVVLIGKANRARYYLAGRAKIEEIRGDINKIRRILKNRNLSEDLVLAEIKKSCGIFQNLPENVSRILDYAFLEILNNAIEHSSSDKIEILLERRRSEVYFHINDWGVGIFHHIMRKKGLSSLLEAIEELLKGKTTTAEERHSGEGIFFTSKVGDLFIIRSSNKKLIWDNLKEDIFLREIKETAGTKVYFQISVNSEKKLSEVFSRYSEEYGAFDKTEIRLKLFARGEDYLSRSQARRLLSGLEKFQTIILDFLGIRSIGQAFADEVFRVWQREHRDKKLVAINAVEEVDFMIQRAKKRLLLEEHNR